MMRIIRSWIFRLILILIPLVMLAALYIADNVPIPASYETTINEATVSLWMEDRFIVNREVCVEVVWEAHFIESIFYNDGPQIGENSDTFCPADDAIDHPTWTIILPDESVHDFELTFIVLSDQFHLWELIAAAWVPLALLAFLPGFKLSDQHDPKRRRFLKAFAGMTGAYALTLGGLAFWRQEQEDTLVQCNGWVVFNGELRDCDRNFDNEQ